MIVSYELGIGACCARSSACNDPWRRAYGHRVSPAPKRFPARRPSAAARVPFALFDRLSSEHNACPEKARASRLLLDRGGNRRELGVQLRAQPVHDRNDGERNAGRDQAVFDRRRAGLVRKELPNVLFQFRLPLVSPNTLGLGTLTAQNLSLRKPGTFNSPVKCEGINLQILTEWEPFPGAGNAGSAMN